MDGLYVTRTSLPETEMGAAETVRNYKRLSSVERAFRSLKSVDRKVRPVFHYHADRVRAHVLLCMLAYYVEWHMRQRLAPLLFDDENPEAVVRPSVASPAEVSESGNKEGTGKRNTDGRPVHSCRTLMMDLATIARDTELPQLTDAKPLEMTTRPAELQHDAFELPGVKLQYPVADG